MLFYGKRKSLVTDRASEMPGNFLGLCGNDGLDQ